MISYQINVDNALSSFVQVKTIINPAKAEVLYLQLPAWRPGRYELQHFAQKIQSFEVLNQDKEPVPFKKITKDRWEVATTGQTEINVLYNFYARQMDAGGSWSDETQLYINPVNCLLAVEGQTHLPCELELKILEEWQVACGMSPVNNHKLMAQNYDQLVDSPLIASGSLQKATYEINQIPFYIWFQGECLPDWVKIMQDFTAFTQEQIALFGDFPVTEYHFLNQILPYPHYHGVEHGNSTVITLGPSELLMTKGMYKELLGISSHELFHTWNIKKIRPAEMMPYDYTQENYFRTGYIAEGVTTYYGDYILARAGIFSAAQYFEELTGVLSKHFVDYGHQNYSVADSSFDLWLDGYKPGIPARKVSIYHKGALAALILDLEIRRATRNECSLDTVMVRLWQEFGKTNTGYTEVDYERLVNEITKTSFADYFKDIIFGTAPLPPYLEKALNYVGCTSIKSKSPLPSEAYYGFKTNLKENSLQVSAIAPGSPAANMLSLDDELIAVNGRKLEGNLAVLLTMPQRVQITLFRNKQLKQVYLEPDNNSYFDKYSVQKFKQVSPEQKQNFYLWLKQEF